MPVQTVIKTRRDTAATWTSTNPVLASGEPGLETDTGLVKFGDGSSAWAALPYMSTSRTSQIAKNDTGASVTKGQVVYISGANGANALFSLADADTELTSSKTVGLLAQNLATNGIGAIVTEGLLSGVNTGTATAGQSVWLSSTAGEFVFGAPPAKPAHSVYLGVVTRASATVGEILVKVQNGYELNELHDVNAGSPADNNLLAWDSATSMWINQTAAQVGVATAADLALKAPIASPTLTGTTTVNSLVSGSSMISANNDNTYNYTGVTFKQPWADQYSFSDGDYTYLGSGQPIELFLIGESGAAVPGTPIMFTSFGDPALSGPSTIISNTYDEGNDESIIYIAPTAGAMSAGPSNGGYLVTYSIKVNRYSGIVTDGADNMVKIFQSNVQPTPTTVNFADPSVTYSDVKVGSINALDANITNSVNITAPNPSIEMYYTTGTGASIDFKDAALDDFDMRLVQYRGQTGIRIEAFNGAYTLVDKSLRNIFISTSAASGGVSGDVWLQYTP